MIEAQISKSVVDTPVPRIRRMKNLSQCVGPLSWAFIFFIAGTQYYILLSPTPLELFLLFVVDALAFNLIKPIEYRVFARMFPEASLYFKGLDEARIKQFTHEQKLELFESLLRFPLKRAIFTTVGSVIKVIPPVAFGVFYWEHQTTNLEQFLIFSAAVCVTFAYFHGAVFIESHFFISDLIKEIHEKFGWKDVFKTAPISKIRSDFEIQEWVAIFTLALFMLALQWTVTTSHIGDFQSLAVKILFVGLAAMLLLSHLIYLSRRFLLGGLKDLFKVMDELDYRNTEIVLPLHSTELLARFEKSFNLLIDRLRNSEQEIAAWIFTEAEKTRYRTLGEMSALVAHDMAGPLHVVKFCIDQIKEEPEKAKDEKYMHHLADNLARILELIGSLRARLKNSGQNESESSILDAHSHVIRLLETQYSSKDFAQIKFEIDTTAEPILLPLSRVDLIHILDNIYRNGVESLLKRPSTAPRIQLKVVKSLNGKGSFAISDSGTGLSPEDFEKLTAFEFLKNKSTKGLGLKLTRRLVELNGGSLTVAKDPLEGFNTTFILELPNLHLTRGGSIEKSS